MNILQNIIPNKSSVYVFFQVSTKTCIKIDHILGCETNLNRLKVVESIQNLFFDHNGIKLRSP